MGWVEDVKLGCAVTLPTDANGTPIRIGSAVDDGTRLREVRCMSLTGDGWAVMGMDPKSLEVVTDDSPARLRKHADALVAKARKHGFGSSGEFYDALLSLVGRACAMAGAE